jgi:hypothetical protein
VTDDPGPDAGCCGADGGRSCVFAKALLARAATCALSQRLPFGERELLECASPVAHINCGTLAALLHERARFALRLPPASRPLMHVQALRLQCGGLSALAQQFDAPVPDVHEMVGAALERHGSLTELPWQVLVPALAAWQPRRRSRRGP